MSLRVQWSAETGSVLDSHTCHSAQPSDRTRSRSWRTYPLDTNTATNSIVPLWRCGEIRALRSRRVYTSQSEAPSSLSASHCSIIDASAASAKQRRPSLSTKILPTGRKLGSGRSPFSTIFALFMPFFVGTPLVCACFARRPTRGPRRSRNSIATNLAYPRLPLDFLRNRRKP